MHACGAKGKMESGRSEIRAAFEMLFDFDLNNNLKILFFFCNDLNGKKIRYKKTRLLLFY